MKDNKDNYKFGFIFLCRGVETQILVGYCIFKNEEGINTFYHKKTVKKAIKLIGVNKKIIKRLLTKDFHNIGLLEWNRRLREMNGIIQLGELKTIVVQGNEPEKHYKNILKKLV